jgi:magnesium transporter
MITVLVHRDGQTRRADAVDPAWLVPGSGATVWTDIREPDENEKRLLSDVFHFHELSIEDAVVDVHAPKIETYDGYLYLVLHGIVPGVDQHGFVTQDVDFFLGPNYLVTVRHGESRSIEQELDRCQRHDSLLREGPASQLHRIVDLIVDHYRPAVDGLEDRLEEMERVVFEEPRRNPLREILTLKSDIASLRRVALPERDALARLARREFPQIPEQLAYRFRDVYDHVVRLTDEAVFFQDRVTSLFDAYLSSQSNRLNQVMKVLTVIATIFMPLTVLTGVYGMNVVIPPFPGGPQLQFWWLMGVMALLSAGMLWGFRRMGWL